ncbi:MAG: ISNCY family transposase, partial [Deltaproteobacteria bacterium]|nr:ISNCY family transposase [Deltaproteobacteria bacterium]
MRKVRKSQMKLGEVNIADIEFDLRCRDEIPKLLMGLQYIFCTYELRKEVFKILKKIIPKETDPDNGRLGMELWKILVLGTLRLNCNWDYDKLQDIANNHVKVREMLGHSKIMDE